MLFPSVEFIFAFLPIVLTVYFILLRRNVLLKNIWLFAASLFFYAFGEGSFILLMLGEILLDYLLALFLNRSQKRWARRTLLSIAIISNIGILGIFKYASFVCVDILHLPPDAVGIAADIHLPLGISFFTFQALSYVLDVYMGKVAATGSFLNVGLYVSFFPQLVAGPIVRFTDIADAINNRKESIDGFSSGVVRFLIGLSKKVLIANNMALVADAAWKLIIGDRLEASVAMAWLGAISYTLQIYFDFSGYSDMAIGLGKIFGFDFPENFKHPYIATSLTEFWRRWHISLSSWFRDYVYIPLGGSRRGEARTYINLMIVWLLTGIWHGANYTFVVWGLLYGILLMIEKVICAHKAIRKQSLIQRIFGHLYTMIVVTLAWVIFRSDSINDAVIYILGMFGRGSGKLVDRVFVAYLKQNICFYIPAIIGCMPILESLELKFGEKNPIYNVAFGATVLAGFVISVSYIINNGYNPFIYFNF
ncbi:MAG: MBOAT family protein [Lachnospiraceae bacterium]|nr:MBOAT family protein [Lachnospiraceae bacterium]